MLAVLTNILDISAMVVVSFEQCLHPLFFCYFVGNEKCIKFYPEGKLLATRKMISTDTAGLIRNGQHPRSTEPDQIVLLSRRSKTWMIQHFQLSELLTRVCTKWFCQIALCHLLQLQRKPCPRDKGSLPCFITWTQNNNIRQNNNLQGVF